MSESQLWEDLNNSMRKFWTADRIENNISKGVPDVFWTIGTVHGMIELKHKRAWPKRPETIVQFRHFTKEQKNFFRRHKGRCFLLVKVDRDLLLFNWKDALQVGTLTRAEMQELNLFNCTYDTLQAILASSLERVIPKG